mmetsp:Transcript_19188/g.62674  ORF Transcript_19188/g.62674 Transcript_19188/m.62674 type:complete len:202 (+) Transcript_19188:1583-2188(+)
MCRRWRVFAKRGSACREIPEDAASEMIAIRFVPAKNASFSEILIWSWDTPAVARASHRDPPPAAGTKRILRPVISATASTPKWQVMRSSALAGILMASSLANRVSRIWTAWGTCSPPAPQTGRCVSIIERAISCGVDTSVSSSLPARFSRSAASLALASPVDSKPMTMHLPSDSAASVSEIANMALIELSSCLKKDWCAPQ